MSCDDVYGIFLEIIILNRSTHRFVAPPRAHTKGPIAVLLMVRRWKIITRGKKYKNQRRKLERKGKNFDNAGKRSDSESWWIPQRQCIQFNIFLSLLQQQPVCCCAESDEDRRGSFISLHPYPDYILRRNQLIEKWAFRIVSTKRLWGRIF